MPFADFFVIEADISPVYSDAMLQNGLPLIRHLSLLNNGPLDLQQLQIEISSDTSLFEPFTQAIPRIPAQSGVDAGIPALIYSPDKLATLAENTVIHVKINVKENSGELLGAIHLQVNLLAFDEWTGQLAPLELLAYYILPEAPAVADILRAALQRYGDGLTTGWPAYQRQDPTDVIRQVNAILSEIQSRQIVLTDINQGLGDGSRRIRFADSLLDSRTGSNLDLALLLAACLEKSGLHAVLLLSRHSLQVGCWLVERCFAEPVQDDPVLIRQLAGDDAEGLIILNAAALAAGRTQSFARGVPADIQAEDLIGLVDVRRCRLQGIHSPGSVSTAAEPPIQALSRQKQWERKLLDLSLRNPLLNFRPGRRTINLQAPNLARFADLLADGEEFQILPSPDQLLGMPDKTRQADLLAFAFGQKQIYTDLSPNNLGPAMTQLFRSARSSLEENGANTLYLALGFLQWYETDQSQQPRMAPLILLPAEIVRPSARKSFVVRGRDEEAQVNTTLLEMLKQDFDIQIKGLDSLPETENGLDLNAILVNVRRAIEGRHRWAVLEKAFLGIFSFTQFIMWNDIHSRAAELAQNRVVASLLAGSLAYVPENLPDPAADLDEICLPDQTFLPISADASQLAAVHAAGLGRSFVLHGPPGTGKSQTITNIIGHALGSGKTVLFVAEKRAALDVVQRRLAQIGLGPFCLELHSNKSRKHDVLDQLRHTLDVTLAKPPADFSREARRLQEQRTELKDYVRQLYHVYPFGFSLADAIARSGELSGPREAINLAGTDFANLDREKTDEWFSQAGELAAAATDCGGPFQHPLADFQSCAWSQAMKAEATASLTALAAAAQSAANQHLRLADQLSLNVFLSPTRLEEAASNQRIGRRLRRENSQLLRICSLALDLPRLPTSFLADDDLPMLASRLKSFFNQGRQWQNLHQEICTIFQDSIFTMSGETLLAAWRHNSQQWILPRHVADTKLRRLLKPHLLPDQHLSDSQLGQALELLASCQAAQKQTEQQLLPFQEQLALFWQGRATDWDAGCRYADLIPELHQEGLALTGLPDSTRSLLGEIAAILSQTTARQVLEQTTEIFSVLNVAEERAASILGIRFDRLADSDDQDVKAADWGSWLLPRVAAWQSGLGGLREWCTWLTAKQKAKTAGLAALGEAIEAGAVQPDCADETFAAAFYQAAANWIIAKEPALNLFSGQVFEEKIRQFKLTGERFEQLTRQEIFARLAGKLPQFDPAQSQDGQLGILLRAIKSNGRGISIRRLFAQISGLLPRLAPCMLMSPISVAQYLDPAMPMFDLVVFDEASQMPSSEAAGAMARGRDTVIVGDPHQLPPTSFFNAMAVDEEDLAAEDLESVLDDCLALPLPQMHLLWHYRSRHESLIAFSNKQYYENRLLTFPSPSERISRVKLVRVDGVYDRGRSKQNLAEAQAVVAEIVRRLADPVLRSQSLGVVTFSAVQQNLIEDLLGEVFKNRPELEDQAMQGYEPVFIKNLENVQGDERDVILFSVGYGPDSNGRISLNFGPLNRDGGWRRLNVAVSRARQEMVVYSTIGPEQLDISRTGAAGVAGLRAFLEYARRGSQPVAVQNAALTDAGLAAQIAAALEENGYATQLMVGASGYRIDLGVIHPEREGEYILGIQCNGTAYREARTTRDREVLQQTVLTQLGWNLHQVWAIDWWENPAREVREILVKLRMKDEG